MQAKHPLNFHFRLNRDKHENSYIFMLKLKIKI